VSHKKLLFKLDNYDIRDATLKWIGSFLNNRMQQAVLDGESSSKLPVVSRVPQGSVLEPFSFSHLLMIYQQLYHHKLVSLLMTVFCFMCAFQVMLDEMVIPRYFAVSTGSRVCSFKM
jgi:hypothetical protein